ncbi:MAG: TonB-dependent receptor [Deltaproteobacteria bacterium]|nr:TonB-dependent receptor [Deltaproteobacteria bacterium]
MALAYVIAAVLAAEGATGQSDAAAAADAPVVMPTLVPPKAKKSEIPYPSAAPPQIGSVDVTVVLHVDANGEVTAVKLLRGAGPPFDEAVLIGAASFEFEPATYGGEPVDVEITYTQRFIPPEPEPVAPATGLPLDARFSGQVLERGTRKPIPRATVVLRLKGEMFPTTTAEDGTFEVAAPSGTVEIRVLATDYLPFRQQEILSAKSQLKVRYLLERATYSPYETVVLGQRERMEVSRTTLRDREIKQVPGTFGDPFRVVTTLPGVSSMTSMLTLPIVRGASPGSTAFLLDGIRLPMLFHFLGGPAVVHPEFIDHVDFYAGGFRVNYGGYTAGIIDGITRPARGGEQSYEVDLGLTQTGGLVRKSVGPVTATVAGRYGYPGLLMKLVNSEAGLSYWDYQTRFDYGSADNGVSVFVLGASDHVTETRRDTTCDAGLASCTTTERTEDVLVLAFHRLDAIFRRTFGDLHLDAGVSAGYESSNFGADAFRMTSPSLTPRLGITEELRSDLTLHAGAEATVKGTRFHSNPPRDRAPGGDGDPGPPSSDSPETTLDAGTMYSASLFVEALWRPTPDWLVIPGVRVDGYRHRDAEQQDVDPRLVARYRLVAASAERGETWLKGALGIYHQPPRLFIPLPGISEIALDLGLLRAIHSVLGVEHGFGQGFEIDLQAYFNWMDPVFLEPQTSTMLSGNTATRGPSAMPGEVPGDNPAGGDPFMDGDGDGGISTDPHGKGRAYGIEVLLRRRQLGHVFGWLAYTLSRSERLQDGAWHLFDYDRTHMFNLVAGVALPRNWEAGLRVLLQSGTPLSTVSGVNTGRSDWQLRFDVRFDKRAVWNEWMLDFYVDVINLTVSPESGGIAGGDAFRYLVPTVGFRGVF